MRQEIINQLLADVVKKFGRPPEQDNYETLADLLYVSPSTLKRYFCSPTNSFIQFPSTLNILSRYVGYEDFEDYMDNKRDGVLFIINGREHTAKQANEIIAREPESPQDCFSCSSSAPLREFKLTDPVTEAFVKKVKESGNFSLSGIDSSYFYNSSIFGDASSFKLEDLSQLFDYFVENQKINNCIENFALFVLRFSGKDILRLNEEFLVKPITWQTPSNADSLSFVIERIINDQEGNAKAGDGKKWEKTARFFNYPLGTIDRVKLREKARPYHDRTKQANDEFTKGLERLLERLMKK